MLYNIVIITWQICKHTNNISTQIYIKKIYLFITYQREVLQRLMIQNTTKFIVTIN